MLLTKKEHERIKASILARTKRKGDCLVWTGAVAYTPGKAGQPGKRYGYMQINGRRVTVRRIAYQVLGGKADPGVRVVECTCGNSLCIKPDHLVRGKQLKSNGPTTRAG